jgi:hypothetical protein
MAMNNTSTKKQSAGHLQEPVTRAEASKDVNFTNRPAKYAGQLAGKSQKFGEPLNTGAPSKIHGLDGLHDDIGEKSGFITEGYLDKGDTPFGENAKFNYLPPGMDIDNQHMLDVHAMPLREVVSQSYPGDGWMPAPRDVQE